MHVRLFITGVLMLAGLVQHAAADDRGAAIDALLGLNRLDADTFMMIYDETDRAQADVVRRQLGGMEGLIGDLLDDLPDTDSVLGNREAWAVVKQSIIGSPGMPGMIATGYDARTLADLRTAIPTLQRAIRQRYGLEAELTPEEAALLQASETLTVYIRTAASPLGSFSDNNDESSDADLNTLVARFDKQLESLQKRHAGNPANRATLQQVKMKWQFLRGTILRHAQQSTPLIVYRHGRDILEKLRGLETPVDAQPG